MYIYHRGFCLKGVSNIQWRDTIAGHSNIRNMTSIHSTVTFDPVFQNFLRLILQSYCCVRMHRALGRMNDGRWIGKDLEGSIRDLMEVLSLYLPVRMRPKVIISDIPIKIRKVYIQVTSFNYLQLPQLTLNDRMGRFLPSKPCLMWGNRWSNILSPSRGDHWPTGISCLAIFIPASCSSCSWYSSPHVSPASNVHVVHTSQRPFVSADWKSLTIVKCGELLELYLLRYDFLYFGKLPDCTASSII